MLFVILSEAHPPRDDQGAFVILSEAKDLLLVLPKAGPSSHALLGMTNEGGA